MLVEAPDVPDDHHDGPVVHRHRVSAGASPLWWSAPQRLACALALIVVLWLVIGWALV